MICYWPLLGLKTAGCSLTPKQMTTTQKLERRHQRSCLKIWFRHFSVMIVDHFCLGQNMMVQIPILSFLQLVLWYHTVTHNEIYSWSLLEGSLERLSNFNWVFSHHDYNNLKLLIKETMCESWKKWYESWKKWYKLNFVSEGGIWFVHPEEKGTKTEGV